MLEIIAATSVSFLAILLGFAFGKSTLFPANASTTLISYVFYLALPASLFLNCYLAPFSLFNWHYLSAYGTCTVLICLITFLWSFHLLKTNLATALINMMAVSQVDGAYFAIPVFLLIFGSSATAIPLIAIQNILFFTLIILLIELFARPFNAPFKQIVFSRIKKTFLTNPIILSSLLGFFLNFLQIPLPNKLHEYLNFFGTSASPVALFALGLSLPASLSALIRSHDNMMEMILLSMSKLLFYPMLAWMMGLLFRVPHTLLSPLVLLCAAPAATHNFIIATKYELNSQMQTNVIVISTLLGFFTINLFLYLLSI